ncbi:hypothetical protein SAMN05660330_04279 [Desulforhopalus singaporensis]|uniref:Lipoprotein n=1 Tax=Desulforhopalus singaporensis TaxID=91360 RepID=A0A1H0VWV7_9BACT|nr:hypothetical protein SAMN05660330_04279 [Desulforhopalus singaporensis]
MRYATMMKILSFAMTLLTIQGCAYNISEIDLRKYDDECVRECSKIYSDCISGGSAVGFMTETLRGCKEAFVVCTRTCPVKQ